MSKKRKTKRQKMASTSRQDFSRVFLTTNNGSISISENSKVEKTEVERPIPQPLHHKSYSYVMTDVKNTLLITTTLIAANILIFLLLKFQLVNLFGIVF